MERKIRSPIKRKVLLLLEAGLVLGDRFHKRRRLNLKALSRAWRGINRSELAYALRDFRYRRLVDYREQNDGSIKIELSELGRRRVLRFKVEEMTLSKAKKWDGRWRVVFFDVPEKKRKGRDALRQKLRELGFHEWQKSVFVYPHPCRDEVDFIVEFFELRPYVRYAELTAPTNEAELRLRFNL